MAKLTSRATVPFAMQNPGNFTIMGRIDDVLNVSGHRLGTMEIESALVAHHLVAEAAVVVNRMMSKVNQLWLMSC